MMRIVRSTQLCQAVTKKAVFHSRRCNTGTPLLCLQTCSGTTQQRQFSKLNGIVPNQQKATSPSSNNNNNSGDSSTTTTTIKDDTKQQQQQQQQENIVQGQILDLGADLQSARPGDRIDIPYEITVSESMQDFWQSAFHAQDRINTSRPYCRQMGLQDRVLPFSLALFLTSSMTHADSAKVQVGFGKVSYLWPAFAGDTFTKAFTVQSVRNTSDGNHSIIHFTCELLNQRGRICMRADKRMLFAFAVPESNVQLSSSSNNNNITNNQEDNIHLFRDHLLSKADVCQKLKSHSLAPLHPNQLILHTLQRSLTFTQSQQLASLARLTHERHFDCRKYEMSELLIPGGLVLGITMSASARDLHEILFEEILSVNYVNSLHPGNMVGAISYIQSVDDAVGDLESVTVRTIGIKNLDVKRDLDGIGLPLELFQNNNMKPKDIEQICKRSCPILQNKIVVQVDRRILRQTSHQEVFLL